MISDEKSEDIPTPSCVPDGDSVPGVTKKKTPKTDLTHEEAERVRARVMALWKELGTQPKVETATGIDQQLVSKICSGQAPGIGTAKLVAAYDRMPVELLLIGLPPGLHQALSRRQWSKAAAAAVSKMAADMPAEYGSGPDRWAQLLEIVEANLAEAVAKHGLPR